MKTVNALKSDDTAFQETAFIGLPREAELWIDHLRSAFIVTADGRRDAHLWRDIEKNATGMLTQRLSELDQMPAGHALQALAQVNQQLLASARALLRRAEQSTSRPQHFNAAVLDVTHSRGFGDEILSSFCRHAALVWLALWHLSDIRSVLAEEVNALLITQTESFAAIGSGSATLERGPDILSRTLRAAAAALRKAAP